VRFVRWVLAIAGAAAAQERAVVLESPESAVVPVPVACGLLDAIPASGPPWRPVRVAPSGGGAVHGVLARAPWGATLHVVLPRIRGGRSGLRIEERAPPPAPASALSVHADGGSWESGTFRVAFGHDGSIAVADRVLRLEPRWPRDGIWRVASRNPVRCALTWRAPGVAWHVVLWAGCRALDATLVLEGAPGGGAAAWGVAWDGDGDDPPAPESLPASESQPADVEPEEPAFEVVVADLAKDPCVAMPAAESTLTVLTRRHGPASPVPGPPGGRPRLLAVDPVEAPAPGAARVLRLRIAEGPAPPVVLARPAAMPRAWPGGGVFGDPSRVRALGRLDRKLDAALAAFRADPRHGLLHRRGDLGDWRMDASRFGNLEWDTSLGFALRWIAGGEPVDAWQAVLGVEHALLCDRDPVSGLFFQHGSKHQSGLVEAGHHWAEGLAAIASLLDDPWLLDEARRLADDQVAELGKLDPEAALPRSLGWALTALCALHERTSDREASRRVVEKLLRFVLARQGRFGHFLIEPSTAREEGWRVSPFVDGGILLPALERAGRLTRDGRVKDAVRRSREALIADAIEVEPGGAFLVSSLLVDRRSGRVVARAGRAEGEEIALFLSGIAGGQDPALGVLLRRAEETLVLDERIFLGKGISMLMRALPACAGRAR
jgi:hypothetical protein